MERLTREQCEVLAAAGLRTAERAPFAIAYVCERCRRNHLDNVELWLLVWRSSTGDTHRCTCTPCVQGLADLLLGVSQ